MSRIIVLAGSVRKGGNTDLLARSFADGAKEKNSVVGAADLPELFDAIETQYQLVLNFFHLEDAGRVLVRGAREKGNVKSQGWAGESVCPGKIDQLILIRC